MKAQQKYLPKNHVYQVKEPLVLECGNTLRDLRIHYTTYGQPNDDQSNVVWVFHALTANSNPVEWWPGIVGKKDVLNPEEYFIICANVLGSCYGSTEATDFEFPPITIRDMVKAHILLKEHMGINQIKLGIGGSLGGQQLLQWAVQEPDLFEIIAPIATNSKHSAWGIAFNETQRMAIESAKDPESGLATARAIAMLSYRNGETYNATQSDEGEQSGDFAASSYQRYQGEKLSKRFSPISYYYLSKAMDSHNVGVGYGDHSKALTRIKSRAVVIGIESDILFPLSEQKYIFDHITNSVFYPIQSLFGHDGFLIETKRIAEILKKEIR